jgi:signal transduction histidine kinase
MPSTPTTQRSGDPTESPDTGAAIGATDLLLLSAAQRILTDPLANGEHAEGWADAADELASLTLAVRSTIATGKPDADGEPNALLRQKLLGLLEAQILREQDGGGPTHARSVEGVLHALEHVRHTLPGEVEDRIAEPFSGPAGSELVAEIAHDLRSPLTAILTLAETLRRGQSGEINEIQRRQLGLIYSAALALSSTASDLIELAHGGERLAEKERSPFSLTEMLESVRDIVYPLAEEKGLSLRFRVDVSEWRLGYALALSRVLLNLTTNALKFTEEGYVEIAVRPAGPRDIECSVRDTGKGIDPVSLETLYEPFRRMAGRQCCCFSGTGLGLVICRRLVQAMGSELQLETRQGWGTRFYFRLQLPPADPLA